MFCRKLLLAGFLLLTGLLFSQGTMTPEKLWSMTRLGEWVLSDDGRMVYYTTVNYDIASNVATHRLWVKEVAAGVKGASEMLEERIGAPIFNLQYLGTKGIAYITQVNNGEFSGTFQFMHRPMASKDAFLMTEIKGGINGARLAPDGSHLLVLADVDIAVTPQEKYSDLPKTSGRVYDDLMFRHWNTWSDDLVSHPFLTEWNGLHAVHEPGKDLIEGKPWDVPLQPFGGIEGCTWAPDSRSLFYTCKQKSGAADAVSTNSDIYQYNLNTGATKCLSDGNFGYDQRPVASPSGRYISWSSMARDGFEADQERLYVMDLLTGKSWNASGKYPHNVSGWTWIGDSSVIFVSHIEATEQLFRLNIFTGTYTQLTLGMHDVTGIAVAGNTWLCSRQSMSAPADLYTFDPGTRLFHPFTSLNQPILTNVKMGEVQQRWVPTTDGKKMLMWIILPPDFEPGKKYPTLLYCQGGPQAVVSQAWSFRWNYQTLAAHGYVILAPNRRGLPSFGQQWNDAISGDWGGQPMQDLLSATDYASTLPFVDKDRMGAIGASYGGYSVYWLAGNHQKRFKVFMSHCGLFNMTSWYGSTEELWFADWDLGGPYWRKPTSSVYSQQSPHLFVDRWDTPMLVIHNDRDYRVPLEQGIQAFTAARMRGIPARFLSFPDEGHWVSKPQNGILWHREVFSWLDLYLKP